MPDGLTQPLISIYFTALPGAFFDLFTFSLDPQNAQPKDLVYVVLSYRKTFQKLYSFVAILILSQVCVERRYKYFNSSEVLDILSFVTYYSPNAYSELQRPQQFLKQLMPIQRELVQLLKYIYRKFSLMETESCVFIQELL